MKIKQIHHVAYRCKDASQTMEFYRDVLGLRVTLDTVEGAFDHAAGTYRRRAAYLRVDDGPHEFFVVLDQQLDQEPFGRAPRIFQIGTHHFSLWVDDLADLFDRALEHGFRAILRPTEADAAAYGEPEASGRVLTAILKDPDGNPVQLDQRL